MPRSLHQVRPAIPLRGFIRIDAKLAGREVELVPGQHPHPDVQRERQPRRCAPARSSKDRRGYPWYPGATSARSTGTASPDTVVCRPGVSLRQRCSNSSPLQAPIPASRSGVMFGATSTPRAATSEAFSDSYLMAVSPVQREAPNRFAAASIIDAQTRTISAVEATSIWMLNPSAQRIMTSLSDELHSASSAIMTR